jgi:aminoglycoside 6-adenylyltransferase
MRMQDLIERFTSWALDQTDVRSAIIVGSWARVDRPADNLSDLDLAVIVTDPSIYLSDATWLRRFGEPGLTFIESTADGNFRERRVLFRDGRDVDFSLLPVDIVQQMVEQKVPAEPAEANCGSLSHLVTDI